MTRMVFISLLVASLVGGCALPSPADAEKTGCTSTSDCLEGRHCVDGACTSAGGDEDTGAVATCPEVPCVAPARCFLGFCSEQLQEPTACEAYESPDGCPSTALCYELGIEVTACEKLPSCSVATPCPVGPVGALCNLGIFPEKEPICMPRYCQTASHCPNTWHCVRYFQTDLVGYCSGGGAGEPCADAGDCDSGDCDAFFRVCR